MCEINSRLTLDVLSLCHKLYADWRGITVAADIRACYSLVAGLGCIGHIMSSQITESECKIFMSAGCEGYPAFAWWSLSAVMLSIGDCHRGMFLLGHSVDRVVANVPRRVNI